MTLSPLLPSPSLRRALLVQPDAALREGLALALRQRGLEVVDCADFAQAQALYRGEGLVVASLGAGSAALPAFSAWLRAAAGPRPLWIIALGANPQLSPGESAAHYGVDDLLSDSEQPAALLQCLDERRHPARPAAPPSYRALPAPAPPWDQAAIQLLEHFPAAVAILDRSLRYLAVNSRWIREFQIPPTPLIGRSHCDIFPDLHPDWRRLYERCLASGEPHALRDAMVRPDGSQSLVHWEIQPWRDTSGAVGGLLLSCSAAPPSAATEPTPKGDDSFREMAEAAPFGMILLDDEAHVLYANPQHRAVLGFAAEADEPIQTWLERACVGDDVFQKRALDEWWESVWRRRTSLTCSLRNAEGLVKDIEFRPATLSGDRLLLTIFDVTDARLDEQAIRTSEARYRGLFQQASAPLLIINPSGNLTEVNPAFEALTGLARHEARRAPLTDFLPPETVDRLRAASLAAGPTPAFPSSLRHRSGSQTPVHLSAAVIRNDQGQPAFTACLLAPLSDAPPAAPWADITPDWLFLLDADGTILEHTTSRDFAPPSDTPAPALRGQFLDAALPLLAAPLPLDVMVERLLDHPGHETRCEYKVTPKGETEPRTLEARLVLLPGGPPSRFGLTLRDLSRARANARPGGIGVALLQHLLTPAILIDERGRILHLNPAAEALSDYTTAELADRPLSRLLRPEAPEEFSAELARQLQTHRSWHAQSPLISKDGTPTQGQLDLTPVFDEASSARGFLLLFRPLPAAPPPPTPSAPSAPAPSVSLHRARNDFQVLSSLLSLQAEDADLPPVRAALLESRQRLAAVALVYRLIQHENDTVDFAHFTSEIGRTLLDTQGRPPGNITLQPEFSGLILPQRLAIGLGLIFEELIAAALAYAFPDPSATGHLTITFSQHETTGTLTLHDTGIPLTASLRALREASFSQRLIKLLAHQIGGSLTLLADPQNQARLTFPLPAPSAPSAS